MARRTLLAGGAATAAGLVAVACSDRATQSTVATAPFVPARSPSRTDVDNIILAAGLEKLLIDAYQSLRDRLDGGSLGHVPPAIEEYVRLTMAHHVEHERFWQNLVRRAGRPPVTAANAQLAPAVRRQLDEVHDVDSAARLALGLEGIAADTYLRAISELADVDLTRSAARIGIVEQQHQAFLLFAIGNYPAPDVFMRPEKAVTP
jgi:hypothetical protein